LARPVPPRAIADAEPGRGKDSAERSFCRRSAAAAMMPGMRTAALLLAPIALLGTSAPAAPPAARGVTFARLGETVRIGGVKVTPLTLREDSRCPAEVRCVWAGRLRLLVRIGRDTRELTLGRPAPMAGGTLLLASVLPARHRNTAMAPRAYRFGFRFDERGVLQLIDAARQDHPGSG
jgi:hypothetical protein